MVLALVATFLPAVVFAAPLDAAVAATHDEAKPTGPIGVDVRIAAPPALGAPLTVTVTARAEAIEGLALEVHADDPAALAIVAQSAPVDRAGARSWEITVIPMRTAGGNLGVVVAGDIDGVAQAGSVVTPIRLAEATPALRARPLAVPEAGGVNLSLLPVEERVRAPK
jgi:hypothetical protein